jgi:hypothetical protein
MIEVTVQLRDEVARQFGVVRGQTPRHILEAIASDGYRSARLSRAQVSQLLQMTPPQTEEFLAKCRGNHPPQQDSDRSRPDFQAFLEALPGLLVSDPGHFVAISNGRVIDRDADEFALAERVSREYLGQQVLIQPVMENGLADVHMDTPEFEPAKGR